MSLAVPDPAAPAMIGVLPLDKPVGPSSFAMVRQLRRLTRVARVGHAGTLDPFASGLLVICIGREATRLVPRLMGGEKEYLATLQLGIETETLDPEGRIIQEQPVPDFSPACIEDCLARFRGVVLQQPPRFSALKHQGKPLYYYARRGIVVEKPPREVHISCLENLGYDPQASRLRLRVCCTPGTYIRSLAGDIGRVLGCGAHLAVLRRLRSGSFSVENAMPGEELQGEDALELLMRYLLPVGEVASGLEQEKPHGRHSPGPGARE